MGTLARLQSKRSAAKADSGRAAVVIAPSGTLI